ncbi:MAG TPA: amidohydrolase family protein [Bryobacteraceae bacterium]|nr:amidohydrolase family protein [Bryobacteraceae bacterium]
MRIDSHQHFWKYDPAQYGWIDESKRVIRRDFLPEHLAEEITRAGIGGTIAVQAGGAGETEWLLGLAKEWDFIRGVVGWGPLIDPHVEDTIERLATNPKLRGLRHVLQDEPDPNYMLREDFNAGIGKLSAFGLAYDILIFERHLPQTIEFVDRHPDQVFVLDHVAKPRIRAGEISPWRENIRELAKRPNVYCKISGMVTEADWTAWTPDQMKPYIHVVLEAFGANRLMFGSDWPVCLVASTYPKWVILMEEALQELSIAEQERIWAGTAVEAYGL